MKLFAISDLHLANKPNREALLELPLYKDDWLLLAGDIGETSEDLEFALSILTEKFKQIVWVPGNHDLWTLPLNDKEPRGEDKYYQLLSVCRKFNVITPEDEYPSIYIDKQKHLIVPSFTLYDYSFCPKKKNFTEAINWAAESGVICVDEDLLFSKPYKSTSEWCHRRCDYTESRLEKIPPDIPIILVNHYPILEEHAKLWRIPRFSIWCGTKRTESWIQRFNISIVVYGHLHIRGTKYKGATKFEEVSFGYPRDWEQSKGMGDYLKEITTYRTQELESMEITNDNFG